MLACSWGQKGSPWEFNLRDVFRWCDLVVKYQVNKKRTTYSPVQIRKRSENLAFHSADCKNQGSSVGSTNTASADTDEVDTVCGYARLTTTLNSCRQLGAVISYQGHFLKSLDNVLELRIWWHNFRISVITINDFKYSYLRLARPTWLHYFIHFPQVDFRQPDDGPSVNVAS